MRGGMEAVYDDIPKARAMVRRYGMEAWMAGWRRSGFKLTDIAAKKALDDDLRGRVISLIEEFKARFVAEMSATAHA